MAQLKTRVVVYTPRTEAAAALELDALASAYRFILDCRAKKEGGPATAPDEGERSSDEFASAKNLTKRAGCAGPRA